MIVLDRLLFGGIRFVLDKVAAAVEAEMNDSDSLREDLLAAQMRFELGEISEEELAETERVVLARLREIREEQTGPGGAMSLGGGGQVEVEIGFDQEE